MPTPIPVDMKYLQITDICRRQQLFGSIIDQERWTRFQAHLPSDTTKAIPSTETESFLKRYAKTLAEEIQSQLSRIDGNYLLFVLSRSHWLSDWRNKTQTSVFNRRRFAICIAMTGCRRVDDFEVANRGPTITEQLVLSVLRFENVCAELHFTQTVYRSTQKSTFFGIPVEIQIGDGEFHASLSEDVQEAIKVYEARKGRPRASESMDIKRWDQDTRHVGSLNDIDQPVICPEESQTPFFPQPLDRKASYLCCPVDVSRKLRELVHNCSLAKLTEIQKEALFSLLCTVALRQYLDYFRCSQIEKGVYRYSIETKGYLIIEHPLASDVIKKTIEWLVEDLHLEEIALSPDDMLQIWTAKALLYCGELHADIQFKPSTCIGIERATNWIVCFPEQFHYLEHDCEMTLRSAGPLGTYFGMAFEDWAVSYIRSGERLPSDFNEWAIQERIYSTKAKNVLAEIDYSCWKDDVLFLVDMKDSPDPATLEKTEAKEDWGKIKKKYLRSLDTKAKKLIASWNELVPAPPASAKYIVPVVCTSWPLFMKVSPRYVLSKTEEGTIPRACTTDEFIEVIAKFDFRVYREQNGHFHEIN